MTTILQRPHPEDVRALYVSSFTRGYNARAAAWELLFARQARAQLRDRLRRLPNRALRVLDVGCGTGRNLTLLRSLGVEVESYRGVDRSVQMLSKIDTAAMPPHYCLDVVDLDATCLLAGDDAAGTYDLVVCTWVLSHLRRSDELIDSMLATAAPEGQVLVAALTQTTHPLGALIAKRYRHLHAWPIDDQIVRDRQPRFIGTGLHDLTIVAEWNREGVDSSFVASIVS